MSTVPRLTTRAGIARSTLFWMATVLILTPQTLRSAPLQEPKTQSQPKAAESEQDIQDDSVDEDLAPAAVDLDVSQTSPLIQELYHATRETKEKQILARIANAKSLLDSADIKATDTQGRTALHWAVFGASYAVKPNVLVAYEDIADSIIQRGVEINREDVYQDTALDYLLYAPTFEMQTLLIEHGASSGFLAAFYHFFDETEKGVPATHTKAVAMSRTA